MAKVRYMFTIMVLMSLNGMLLEVEASALKSAGFPGLPFGGGPGVSKRPIGGEPDFSGLHEALLLEPVDIVGNIGTVDRLPVANIGTAVSTTSSVVAKRDKGDDVVSLFIVLTAAGIAKLTKSLFYWFGGKDRFDFLDTSCKQKTYPYINRLQLRYKSEFECDDYPDTGYGRSANRRKAADEAMEDFLKKTNARKLFKKSVVDQWMKSHAVPTPVTQKPKGFGEICG